MIALLYVLLYIALIFTPFAMLPTSFIPGVGLEEVSLFNYGVLGLVGLVLFWKNFYGSWKKMSGKISKVLVRVIGVYLLSSLAMGILATIFNLTTSQNQELILNAFGENNFLLSLITLGILGPITEEIIYREILIGKGRRKLGTALAGLVSTFIFAWIHTLAGSLIEIVIYLPLSFGFVWIYLKEDLGLVPSTLAHVVRNVIAVLTMYFIL